MEYRRIIRRAANIVWQYKFLIVLGVLAALGSGGGSNFNYNVGSGDFNWQGDQPDLPREFPQDVPTPSFNAPDIPSGIEPALGVFAGVAGLLLCGALLIGLLLFVVSSVARGGLVTGVNDIEEARKTNLSKSWSAAWQQVWTLLGIGFLPALPVLALAAIALTSALAAFGAQELNMTREITVMLGSSVGILVCILLPFALILGLLRTFAERAALLEGMGVVAAYSRGWTVLTENFGSAFVLFLLQIAINIGLGILMFLPGALASLCCFLWPLWIIFGGAMSAFFSAMWTLAWREWTGDPLKKAL